MVFNLRTFSYTESIEDDPTPPKSFSLKELRVATDKFSSNNFLGEGTGCKVYRGRLANGSLVAVKRAHCVDRQSQEVFEEEMKVGRTVSTHPNVLCLRGFCRTKKELLLVYPLMINNSLSYHLRERPDRFARPLDWATRKRIALGAARGLAHLHNQGNIKIMHRDIKASNILLNAHFEAVIGGFSIALIMHEGNVEEGAIKRPKWSADSGFDSQHYQRYEDVHFGLLPSTPLRHWRGSSPPPPFVPHPFSPYPPWAALPSSPPALPPFLSRCSVKSRVCGTLGLKCTLKNDVFAYGKMLVELISGQPIDDFRPEDGLRRLMNEGQLGRVIDPNLQGNYVEEEAERLVQLALLCAHGDPSVRPETSEVVRILESQFLQREPSTRSSWSQSEGDSTLFYSFPPSPSPSTLGNAR